MPLKKYRPLSPDPYVNKIKGDTEFARLAHVNDLVNQTDNVINNIPQHRSSDFQIRDETISNEGVLINEVPVGAITDGVLPRTLGGAMSSAIISKVGQFDKLAVTGGNQGSFIYFNNVWLSDGGSKIKLSVKVENLNKDGVSGTSYLGIAGYGLNFTSDTGSGWNIAGVAELVNKGMGFYNFANNYTAANTLTTSSGTLVSSGDILDLEFQFDVINGGLIFKVTNRTSGEYINGSKIFTLSGFNYGWVRNYFTKTCRLGIIASNADYTILDYKVYSGVTSPLASFIGDNYATGYNWDYQTSLIPRLYKLLPYQFSIYNVNGGAINNMAQVQVQEALKLNPKYIFLMAGNLTQSAFISTNPGYAAYYTAFTNMIKQIIAKNATPVLVKWPSGGQNSANYPQWYTFVDQQVVLYPQIKILDLRFLPITYFDSFLIPSGFDFELIANAINEFLIAEGY